MWLPEMVTMAMQRGRKIVSPRRAEADGAA
jgi:hypothetical protein